LSKDERLDILMLHARMRSAKDKGVSHKIATLLARKRALVEEVWSTFKDGAAVVVKPVAGNCISHHTRIKETLDTASAVQRFVREQRVTRTRTVAKDVREFLYDSKLLSYDKDSPKSCNAALRTVQRYLSKLGYKRGKKKGKVAYRLALHNRLARDQYVVNMCASTQHVDPASRKRVVYLDESYIHHHYKCHDDSLFDPNDELDVQDKEKHKGQRLCFIGAIVDGGMDNSRFIALDIFQGGKQTKDYHGMFNSDYFREWFKKLLAELKNSTSAMQSLSWTMQSTTSHCQTMRQKESSRKRNYKTLVHDTRLPSSIKTQRQSCGQNSRSTLQST
jgi:hypothetical protein